MKKYKNKNIKIQTATIENQDNTKTHVIEIMPINGYKQMIFLNEYIKNKLSKLNQENKPKALFGITLDTITSQTKNKYFPTKQEPRIRYATDQQWAINYLYNEVISAEPIITNMLKQKDPYLQMHNLLNVNER